LTVILDYGMGNLRSIEKAILHLGFDCRIQRELTGASKVILPGVGAFGAAMRQLAPVATDIRRFVEDGGALLGICLGQQLLFEASEELGEHRGLGLLAGRVRYLPPKPSLKVPHMGWNRLSPVRDDFLLQGVQPQDQVYFVHSLYTDCSDPADVVATSDHGTTFAAAVRRNNVWGTQFHPEKSGAVGLQILRNFHHWS
jgi:glutamine amidotransferase